MPFIQTYLLIALAACAHPTFSLRLSSSRIQDLQLRQPRNIFLKNSLHMAVYSSDKGVPAALVEERDACGVGFIASLRNEASHEVVKQALDACACMEHRGASSADNVSGDGAGVMTAIPWDLFKDSIDPNTVKNMDGSIATAVGMIFLPKDDKERSEVTTVIERCFARYDLELKVWRDVPIDKSVLGRLSADYVPHIRQAIIQTKGKGIKKTQVEFEKVLYDVRREIQGYFRKMNSKESYICSLSSKTIVYKGMLRSCDLPLFYSDLRDPRYKSAFAIYHRRFSTNTVPKWFLAQPMRMLAHNGEINTLLGNINWVKSRQYSIREQLAASGSIGTKADRQVRGPLVDVSRSDSANLDSILDSYVKSGRTPEEALMMLVPEAYQSQPKLQSNTAVQSFYKYFESMQEAWDGPALLVFSDGNVVGATLDRNGLRPARYMITSSPDGKQMVHVMSEVGVTKALQQFASPEEISHTNGNVNKLKLLDSGRLGPGEMLSVNLQEGKLFLNDDIKITVASKRPYEQWVHRSILDLGRKSFRRDVNIFIEEHLSDVENQKIAKSIDIEKDMTPVAVEVDSKNLIETQTFFGWGTEDVEVQISAMAAEGVEATFCMGDDAPLAALSTMPHTLYDYFKQRFAQVTNPPIDPLREGAVMSLTMFLGPRSDPLQHLSDIQPSKRVKIESPILNTEEFEALVAMPEVDIRTISTLYPVKEALTQGGLQVELDRLCEEALRSVVAGASVIHLSDKKSAFDEDLLSPSLGYQGWTYIPPLLAVGAVHHRLIEAGLRTKTSIVVSTGQAWSTHHVACLIGFGASAVIPYAAYDAVLNWHGQKRNQLAMERGDLPKLSSAKALANYRKALEKGLLKILSKIGISLLTSYNGAQIFEALGLSDDVIMKVFKGTPCRISGLSFDEIAAETVEFARKAFGDTQFEGIMQKIESENISNDKSGDKLKMSSDETIEVEQKKLFNYGFLNYFKSGEYHHNNQPLIKTLHSSVRQHDLNLYKLYEENVKSRPPTTLRDTLEFVKGVRPPIPLDQVESTESIMKRFCTGGMSLGALSREAHETLAISMNRIGGKSNCGEGGEDPIRRKVINDVREDGISSTFPHLKGLQNGDIASSKIKQIASGRFGVTPAYLVSGDQLEIKIAQGAKPGEGGQLPGAKIDAYIAGLRKSKPGVTLISPPPHHDIYSIEDLAQLIYDLHQVNPKAYVSVKLVSEVGIGTVSSGVAKAGADVIQISGHDGGTGASPVSSIKHAGSPWELGLVETHSTLLQNGLRDRVLLRVDGGLKTGWDVVMGAVLGAEEYGFGTIAMIAEGCIMARICHTNKCPVGVTTQNEALRKRFPGTPDNVVTFFGYVAEEVRHILAELGYKSLEEVIGRAELVRARKDLRLKKVQNLDVSYVIDSLYCIPEPKENFCSVEEDDRSWLKHGPVFSNGITFDDKLMKDPSLDAAIKGHGSFTGSYRITNTDRSSFGRISGHIASLYGDDGFKGRLKFDLTGAAGQSFCCFLSPGMDITLQGYANDYVAKGMAGGKVTISPPVDGVHTPAGISQSVVGNTVLYGATAGQLFVRGRGGERFAVRNSGAVGVVEGLGDHGCEYMTGGLIVSLGSTGRNFGAGMTGGLAFVFDDDAWLDGKSSSHSVSHSISHSISHSNRIPFTEFVNKETVSLIQLTSEYKAARDYLKELLEVHVQETGSLRASKVLANFDSVCDKIWMVVPASEKNNALVAKESVVSVTSSSTSSALA